MKIECYYPDRKSLGGMEEPYWSAFDVFNDLYMNPPQGGIALSSKDVIDYFVMNCVRTIAEKLTEEEYSFPSVFLKCKEGTFINSTGDRMDFSDFRVNADYEHAAIFGAVYYVLAVQGQIRQKHLDFIEKTFTSETRLKGYFQPFKDAAEKRKAENHELKDKGKKDEAKKLTPAQAGLFCEAFLKDHDCTYTNKKETIAPLASKLFGWAESTMERNLVYSKEDRQYVAKLFETVDPNFSSYVQNYGKTSANKKEDGDSEKDVG